MKIVEVLWRDSCAHRGWRNREDTLAELREADYMDCRTTGYLVLDEEDRIAIALSASDDFETLSEVFTIPREAISEIKEFGEPLVRYALADRQTAALADRQPALCGRCRYEGNGECWDGRGWPACQGPRRET